MKGPRLMTLRGVGENRSPSPLRGEGWGEGATPRASRPLRWGLAGYRQLDPSHRAPVTREGSDFEPCLPTTCAN